VILSKRERYAVIGVIIVIGVLALDRLVLTPMLDRRKELQDQTLAASADHDRAEGLLKNRPQLSKRWNGMLTGGLKSDASSAVSQVLHRVELWASESGLAFAGLKPERTEKYQQFQIMTFRANGTGNLSAIGKFLWHFETADIPIRVTDLQLTSRKEGTDDLSIQFGISTIYLPPETDKSRSEMASLAREERP